MTDGPIMLVDAYSIFCRNYVTLPMISENGDPVGGALGFLRSVALLASKFKPSEIVCCWEGGGSARRKQLLPEYKAGRKPLRLNRSEIYGNDLDSPENFNWQVALCVKLVTHLPMKQVYVDDCEADDVIGWLTRYKFKNEEREIVIISADQDMHQLLRPGVVQYTPVSKKLLTYEDVREKFDVSTINFVTARALIGDSSDSIPGIKGVGFKTLAKRFPMLKEEKFFSLDDIFTECSNQIESKSKLKLYKNILEEKDRAKLNWQLMYLDLNGLSAEHIKKLHYRYDEYEIGKNKFKFLQTLNREGVNKIKNFNPELIWTRLSSIKK